MATEAQIRSALNALPEREWPEEFLKSTEHYDVSPQGEIKRDWIEEAAQGYGYGPYLVSINTGGFGASTVAVLSKNADEALETAGEWVCTKYYESLPEACEEARGRGEGVVSVRSLLDATADNPSAMGSDDFVEAVKAKADLGDGYLVTSTHNKYNDNYDSAHIAFYNVPKEAGRGGGGAVAMNNRLLMFVEGFGKGQNEPPPKGKVKFSVGAAELLPRDMRPRGKTASPERMVDYVADIISGASKLPSELPPGSRASNPGPVSANDLIRNLKF